MGKWTWLPIIVILLHLIAASYTTSIPPRIELSANSDNHAIGISGPQIMPSFVKIMRNVLRQRLDKIPQF
jgi:hypothetical protein